MSELLPCALYDAEREALQASIDYWESIVVHGRSVGAEQLKAAYSRRAEALRRILSRRASPPAQTGEQGTTLLAAADNTVHHLRKLADELASAATAHYRAIDPKAALTHSPGPAEARWVPSLSAKRYSGWSIAMMANSPTTEYVAACDYDSLAAAFKKYGHHTWDESGEPCAKDFGVACTCGFDSALSQSRQGEL